MLLFKSTEWIRAEVKRMDPAAKLYFWQGNYGTYYRVVGDVNFNIKSPRQAWIKAYKYLRYL